MQGVGMIWVDRQRLLAADLRVEILSGAQMAEAGLAAIGSGSAWALRGRPGFRAGSPVFATIHLQFPRPLQRPALGDSVPIRNAAATGMGFFTGEACQFWQRVFVKPPTQPAPRCVTTPVDRHNCDALKPKFFLDGARQRRFLGRFERLNIYNTGQFRNKNNDQRRERPLVALE
jgi:hypothetical protein